MRKKKITIIHLNDSNNTVIETKLTEVEFMKRFTNNRYNASRAPMNFDYMNTVIQC